MANTKHQMSETHLLGLLLALVGGFLDAYTYVCRGHVFANAQPGNLVLGGIYISRREWGKVLYYFTRVLAFVLGILICEMIQSRLKWRQRFHWRQIVILIEIIILGISGFLPLGSANTTVNIMISFVCALQVEAFRKMNGNPFATTMCTGNLRSATENLYLYTRTKDRALLKNSLQYYNVILFFIIGAAVGGFLTVRLGGQAVWLSCAGLAAVFLVMFHKS